MERGPDGCRLSRSRSHLVVGCIAAMQQPDESPFHGNIYNIPFGFTVTTKFIARVYRGSFAKRRSGMEGDQQGKMRY